MAKGDAPRSYADVLAQQAGPPPPTVGVPPQMRPQLTMPQPTPPAPAGPPPGVAPLSAALPPQLPPDEAAQRAQYEAAQQLFAQQLVADFAAHKISRDDLKKGVAYAGTEPYETWKKNNVTHIKERAKAMER